MSLLPTDTEKRVRFALSAEPGSQVFIAGTFNNWTPPTIAASSRGPVLAEIP